MKWCCQQSAVVHALNPCLQLLGWLCFDWQTLLHHNIVFALYTHARVLVVQMGDVVEGVVQVVKPYGVFVDIGAGLSGLLHLSQISGDRITSVDKIFAEGDKIKVSGIVLLG
jgi:transcriptional accessory protein Tex/SPT6